MVMSSRILSHPASHGANNRRQQRTTKRTATVVKCLLQTCSALVEATGLIRYISHRRKKPGGKIRVLFPIDARGLEVEFLLEDIAIPNMERVKVEAGMTMQFCIKGDSSNGFTAHKVCSSMSIFSRVTVPWWPCALFVFVLRIPAAI